MKETKFYICEKCGNLVGVINASGVPMKCCGQNMTALVPGVFAAGDIRTKPLRQIVTAASDGAVAGEAVEIFLQKM